MGSEEKTATVAAGDVGVVIVTFNSARVIGRCLASLLSPGAAEPPSIVVVDNASSDDTREILRRYPDIRLIENRENRGFAAGVNQGIRELPCRLILLVNPDAELRQGLESLRNEFQRPAVGAATGLLIGADGRPQTGFGIRRFPTPQALVFEALGLNRIWPGNPVNRRYRWLDGDFSRPADVEQPAGAFLMLRRDVWERLGGFDEHFCPVWFEEVDFLRRLSRAGFRIRFQPAAIAAHEGAHSLRNIEWEWRQLYWYASLCRYSAKHFGLPGRLFVSNAVLAGSFLRTAAVVLRSRSVHPLTIFGKVAAFSICSLRRNVPAAQRVNHASRPDHQAEPVELKGSLTRT